MTQANETETPRGNDDELETLEEVPEAVLARLRAEHGGENLRILECERPKMEIVVKLASSGAVDIYRKASMDLTNPERMSGASSVLFWGCVVWPEKKELAVKLKNTPMTPDVLGAQLVKLAGERQNIRVKKV